MAEESSQRNVFSAGTQIFREGDPGRHAYLIERGRVEISAMKGGQGLVIAVLGPGELFGEMALIDNQSRTATATALEETEVVAISRDRLQGKIEQADPLLALLLRVILKRFRWSLKHALAHKERSQEETSSKADERDWILENTRHHAINQIKLTEELERALDRREFELHYQPIMRSVTNQLAGFEALIRWQHPSRGLLPPCEFVGALEDRGLVEGMGLWALEQACQDLSRFHEQARQSYRLGTLPFVSVNLSPRQLHGTEEVSRLAEVLKRVGVDSEHVQLEITESLLIENPELSARLLADLKKLGFSLAIDDFGTGYSSLSYLHRFPLDILKIDRSFVQTMVKNRGSLQVVRAIVGLARELDMDIIAEGVSTVEQFEALTEVGCDFVQGFLWSKPLPFAEAAELLESDSRELRRLAGVPR